MPPDLHTTLGAAFFGFSVGAMYVFIYIFAVFLGANDGNYRLFGITVRQAYQYYTDNPRDSKIRKCIVCGHWKFQAPRGDVDASAHILFQLFRLRSCGTFDSFNLVSTAIDPLQFARYPVPRVLHVHGVLPVPSNTRRCYCWA